MKKIKKFKDDLSRRDSKKITKVKPPKNKKLDPRHDDFKKQNIYKYLEEEE